MNILLTVLLAAAPASAQQRPEPSEALQMIERLAPSRAAGVEIGRPAAATPLEERLRRALEDGPAPACVQGRRAIKTGEPDEPYRCVRWERRPSALARDEHVVILQGMLIAARRPG